MLALAAAALLARAAAAAAPLDLPKGRYEVRALETTERDGFVETLLAFPSPVKSPWPANDTVYAHLTVRRGLPPGAPAVLVLPVMAAPNAWIEERFVRRFARDGFVVMRLEMPTQLRRRPHPSMPSGQVFLARSAPRLAANFRQSILDGRRALEVLAGRPEADSSRIAVFGISLGALVGAAVHSIDDRPRHALLLMGGADFPSLVLEGSLTGPVARKLGVGRESLAAAWRGLDPLDYRARNAGKRATLVNVNSDTVIPRANALKLKEAFPAAEQVWLPLGHYTAIVHLLWLPGWASKRLQAALAG